MGANAIIRRIFVGRTGLRAGWSLLIFALLVVVMVMARGVLLRVIAPVLGAGPHDPLNAASPFVMLRETSLAVLTLGATFFMARIEGRRLWSYGLDGSHSVRNFVIGSVGGMIVFSALIGLMTLGGYLDFDGAALGMAVVSYGAYWAVFYFVVGFFEETFFRGYVQYTLARGIGFWPAAIGSSVAFGLAHVPNSGEDLAGIAVVILGGIILSLCLKLSGSLWWGIGFHTVFGWAESFVYGTANSGEAAVQGHLFSTHPVGDPRFSGGAAGPEGSYICAALFLLVIGLASAAAVRQRRNNLSAGSPLA